MNKYQISIDSVNHDRCRGFDSTLVPNLEGYHSIDSEHASAESAFFTDDQYKEHSKQLVDALSEWAKQLKFVDCEYVDGKLQMHNETLRKPSVSYIGQMLKHLDSAYNDTFPDVDQIQSQRNIICNQIRDLMTTEFGPIPHKPSFQMILDDQIKKCCPNLKRMIDSGIDVDISSFYIYDRICKIVFETVRDNLKLELSIRPSPINGFVDLARWNSTIARGDKESILKLKSIIERFVTNDDIHIIIEKYHELKNQLYNDSNILHFMDVVTQFHDFIHAKGRTVLGGLGSCNLCSDVEFRIK